MKQKISAERDEEIEMIIARLEEESSTSKKEQEKRHQLLLQEVQKTSREWEIKYNEISARIPILETKIGELEQQIKSKVSSVDIYYYYGVMICSLYSCGILTAIDLND